MYCLPMDRLMGYLMDHIMELPIYLPMDHIMEHLMEHLMVHPMEIPMDLLMDHITEKTINHMGTGINNPLNLAIMDL